MEQNLPEGIRPEVLSFDDIAQMAPVLGRHPRLTRSLMRLLAIDKVNKIHSDNCATPGPQFCRGLLEDLNIKLRIDNAEILDRYPEGPFITVSNHPFGALDGIMLIDIVGSRRPDYKVMVNMILNKITAMRPNFIAVDALASDDPAKKAVSMKGIKEAIVQVRRGHPLGFFPAGAVGKLKSNLRVEDRQWQPSVLRLIEQLRVPVIPIYFHGNNSLWFTILGLISWQLRTLRLPAEVFRRKNHTFHISIGEPVSVAEQEACPDYESLGRLLRSRTYAMRSWK